MLRVSARVCLTPFALCLCDCLLCVGLISQVLQPSPAWRAAGVNHPARQRPEAAVVQGTRGKCHLFVVVALVGTLERVLACRTALLFAHCQSMLASFHLSCLPSCVNMLLFLLLLLSMLLVMLFSTLFSAGGC